jgi:protoporphyrinogen oxidase
MSQLNTDLLIIGAGITGLTAAKFYAEKYPSRQVLIIEKYHKVGGFCRTNRVGEFIWDRAGHFFHFKTDLVKDLFSKSLKSIDFIHKSKNTITYDCNSIKIPFPHQKNWNCYTPDIQKKIIQDWSSSK